MTDIAKLNETIGLHIDNYLRISALQRGGEAAEPDLLGASELMVEA